MPELKTRSSREWRVCTHCNMFQNWKYFHKHINWHNGRYSLCKECTHKKTKEKRNLSDKNKEYQRKKYRSDPRSNEKSRLNNKYYRDKTNKRNREIIGKRKNMWEAKADKIAWLSSVGYSLEYLHGLYWKEK